MNHSQYTSTPATQLVGQPAVILEPHSNTHYTIPRGTVVTIVAKYAGLEVRTAPCSHCGVQVHISRVRPEKLELLADLVHSVNNQPTCSLDLPGARSHPHPGRVTCPECTGKASQPHPRPPGGEPE